MKKLLILLSLLLLAVPACAQPLTIIGQRMNIRAVRPGDAVSPRHVFPVIRYRYTGARPTRVRIGWSVVNGRNAEVERAERTVTLWPGKTVTMNGPDFFDYSGAQLKLRGFALSLDGTVLVERRSAPVSQQ